MAEPLLAIPVLEIELERDGSVPETVKGGQVATRWAENLLAGSRNAVPPTPASTTRCSILRSRSKLPARSR